MLCSRFFIQRQRRNCSFIDSEWIVEQFHWISLRTSLCMSSFSQLGHARSIKCEACCCSSEKLVRLWWPIWNVCAFTKNTWNHWTRAHCWIYIIHIIGAMHARHKYPVDGSSFELACRHFRMHLYYLLILFANLQTQLARAGALVH